MPSVRLAAAATLATAAAAVALLGCGDETSCASRESWTRLPAGTGGCMQTARSGPAGAPARIAATGCYTDVATHAAAPQLLRFEVRAPLWTDGALKRRFIALPAGAEGVRYSPDKPWEFPLGTVLVKEFWLERVAGRRDSARPMETRFLVRQDDGAWAGYSYRWNDSGTAADLLPDKDTHIGLFSVRHGSSEDTHAHIFPSREDCFWCHEPERNVPLGPTTAQLNFVLEDCSGARENQLAAFKRLGLFAASAAPPDDTTALPALADVHDATGSLDARARAYLDVNCASCHYGRTFPSMDLRFDTPLAATETCNAPSYRYDIGEKLIVPGEPERSVLLLRMQSRRILVAMPPAGTRQVDSGGVELVRQWIASLESCPEPAPRP